MGIKPYSVTLDIETVNEAKDSNFGAKLSPILNTLLTAWVKDKDKMEKIIKEILEDHN